MNSSSARRNAKGLFGLSAEETARLRKLSTPQKVQDYLDALSFNYETREETCMSPQRVMREKKAHCIEGAMLACTAFMLAGRKPLILNLKVDRTHDNDHVVVLFQEHGYWGAVSKTNHAVLRYRDPVYKTIRELAMSYFNEYFLVQNGKKTMRGFSQAINMRRFGTRWVAAERDLWDIAAFIYDSPHTDAIPKENRKFLRKATSLEQKAAKIAGTH